MRQVDPPPALVEMQRQFGEVLTMPFWFQDGKVRRQIGAYPPELVRRMVPRAQLTGRKRLAVYNRQYWYRILNTLQGDFPLLTALLTAYRFNQLATAYLGKFPSTHPSLQELAHGWNDFLSRESEWGQSLYRQAAELDTIYRKALRAEEVEAFNPALLSENDLEKLPQQPLRFQETFALFTEDWNLVECRLSLERTAKSEQSITPRYGRSHWAFYREASRHHWVKLTPVQFSLLSLLHSGETLEVALSRISDRSSEAELEELQGNIAAWFSQWVAWKWFAPNRI